MNLFTLADGRRAFHQWDTGRQLIVHDEACNEVHFCNGSDDSSLVCKVFDKDDQRLVNVPNILLQDTRSITVFAFVEEESGGYTRRAVVYNVRARSKPDDYVYTETEVLNYQTLATRMDEWEKHGVPPELVAGAIKEYFSENPVEAGATAEEAAQITQNKEAIDNLKKDKLDAAELPTAVNDALTQAKESGLFDGAPGEAGPAGPKGDPGDDYILTEADKTEIAEQAAGLVKVPDSTGNVDLTGYAKEQWVQQNYQPKGEYLTKVPDGYAKTTDIPTKPEDIGAQPAGNYLTEVPEGYAKTSDIPTDEHIIELIEENAPESSGGGIAVTGATVGQTVKIAAVDENGVPTAWEAVDFPSGGGSGSAERMRFITKVTTTEDLSKLIISEDSEGKPFALTRVAVHMLLQGADSNNANIFFRVNDLGVGGSAPVSGTSKQNYQFACEMTASGDVIAFRTDPIVNPLSTLKMQIPLESRGTYGDYIVSVGFTTYQSILAGSEFFVWGC